jgi:acyl-CoA thioester hydrolase
MKASNFSQQFTVKWSDCDPNRHLRGTVYLDYADHTRFAYLQYMGITNEKMKELHVGPVIFNVSASYKKEAHLMEVLTVHCKLEYMSEDGRKWAITHEITNEKAEIVCVVKAEGAWLDLINRKITIPPIIFKEALKAMNEQIV